MVKILRLLVLCLPGLSLATVVEEVIDIPVSVQTAYGQEINQSIKLTIFRDDAREKAPYLVLNHGRPAKEVDFFKMGRQKFTENSRYFVALGFVVLVPTRVGYGESGGPDVEYSGGCGSKNFEPVYAAAADQTIAVLKAAATLPFVDVSRGIVVGQSFGGMTSITLSTTELPGLRGTINFAGGGGGDPVGRTENPCGSHRIAALFKDYGAIARVPTLWLYSVNDRYWGPELPREWFDLFVQAGGKAEFVQLPAYKEDGHMSFTGNRNAWKSAFESFLQKLGFQVATDAQPSAQAR